MRSDGPSTGSEFIVTLPRSDRVRPVVQPPAAPAESAQPRGRILVVDGNRDALTTLALLLRQLGHAVYDAGRGDIALGIAASARPDLVLLDIAMAGMGGYEVMRRMRDAGFTGRIAALTGYGSDEDRKRALGAGFDAHFVKPVDPAAIEQLLTSAGTGARSSG